MIKKGVTSKYFILVSLFTALLCFASIGVYHVWYRDTKSNADTQNPKDLEFVLASKYQLLTVGEENLKAYIEVLNTARDAYNNSNPEGKVLSKDELKMFSEDVLNRVKTRMESAKESARISLLGLKNNMYVGRLARQMLDSLENDKAIWTELGELFTEMMSDIKIAKSLGINTTQYESSLRTFSIHWMTFEMLRGLQENTVPAAAK